MTLEKKKKNEIGNIAFRKSTPIIKDNAISPLTTVTVTSNQGNGDITDTNELFETILQGD